ncbi:putative late blight resistance protein homolog R1A-3 [Solanum verrucosum]|uniref:putative late blight resistance protein homolog R1A-3 n=1 Tax=Solanum verrucosum TaxID=315347 RepID=UPI0020D098D1|nr:putative late blight resistance protein homolog R1A-3 [Solanum verrucosum]
MAQNEIEEMLDHLRRIKSEGNLSRVKIGKIEILEMVLRVFRTFVKYHHVLLPDPLDKLIENAKWTVNMLQWALSRIPKERKTNLNLERLESHLLKIFEGTTCLSYNYELNDFDLLKYMDCLEKNLNDVLMMCLEKGSTRLKIKSIIMQLKIVQKKMRFLRYLYATEINGFVNHEKLECLETRIEFMADNVGQYCLAVLVYVAAMGVREKDDILNKPPYLLSLIVLVEMEMKKIFLGELKASKFTRSKTFKDKKLPKGFSHQLHSLLMYLRNKKLENFPNNISAQNIDVAIEFLLVFLDADMSNHVINGSWLNEVMEKVGAIAGDVLYAIQKLLPSSINKDGASKISLFSLQILEKTKDLKAQVETYYKSLKFTPSQFPTFGGLSFLDSLLRKLNEMSKSKFGLDFLMKPLLGNLEKELSTLTSISEKELSYIFKDEHRMFKDLQRRPINLAYEAEVSIDSILAQYDVFWHMFCSLPTIIEIKKIIVEVTEMWSVDIALKPCYAVEPSKHLQTRHSNQVSDEEIVGFELAVERLIQYLTRGTSELDVIPIVGMGGQGKTTCARKLYNNGIIVSRFDVRAWCIVSQKYNQKELLQDIFSQVTGTKDNGDRDDILADMLRKNLMGKRYLIVLDDMWDCMAWDGLRLSFPDVGNRSRIVVTTRLEKVGKHVMHHIDPYSLPFLTTKESCQLLQRKVFQQEDCPPGLEDTSQAVAETCKGLPLVVVLVAGIIKKRKMEESWWNEVKDALFDYLDRESEEYSQATMQLSFDNLPDCLRPCLLYMGMFSEDAIIPVSKLISLWIAEDLVENIKSAEDYLMDLISSNVVMVSKREHNGKVKYCHVHDVVFHFCLVKSREEKFMLTVKGQFQPLDRKGSRVSFSCSEEHSKTQKHFHQHLRSLITTNRGKSNDGIPFCQISQLRLLKVLDLSSHSVDRLSSATFKPLYHLKYLAVLADEFYFHPESHLLHLETLIVKNDWIHIVLLPTSFWEMEKLRHVEIYNAKFDEQGMFEGSSKLENLRILRNVRFPTKEIDRVNVLLKRCPNLHQLHIGFWGIVDSGEPFCPKLENLMQLQVLRLFFPWTIIVSGLQLPSNIKKLILLGTGIESVISFIVGLPRLEYLKLEDVDFTENEPRSLEWFLRDITFHKLKFLKLVNLNISRWDTSEESFPLLETLVVKRCDNLEEIPLSFADIPTLKQIKLIYYKNESLKASVVKIKENVEENEGNDRIDLITIKVSRVKLLHSVFEYVPLMCK